MPAPKRAAWSTPNFRRLWLAMFASQLGFWISITTLQWFVADASGGDEFQVGLLYFIQLAPMLVLTPWVGSLVDSRPKGPIIKGSLVGLMVIGYLGGVVMTMEVVPHLRVAQVLAGAFGLILAITAPAFHAALPATVRTPDLTAAISRYVAGQNVARLAGPSVAAALVWVGLSGVSAGLYALAGCATIAVVAFYAIRSETLSSRTVVGHARLTPAIILVAHRVDLRRALFLVSVTSTFGLSYVAMLPIIALRHLGAAQEGYATLLVMSGLGALVGSLLAGRWRPRLDTAGRFVVVIVLGMVMLAVSTTLWAAGLACLVTSTAGVALMVSLNVTIQSGIEDEFRGRVMSLYVWAWGGLLPIGALVLGVVARAWDVRTALLATAAVLLASIALDHLAFARRAQA